MATTSPDGIRSPNPTDPYNLVADWAITTSDVQAALVKRGNLFIGTSAQRNSFTTAAEGTHWQDTNGTRGEWIRQSGAWVGGDSGWVDCARAAGVGQQGGRNPQVRRIGKIVQVRWGVSGASFQPNQGGQAAFTIPAGYRPGGGGFYSSLGSNYAGAYAMTEINATTGVAVVRTGPNVGSYYMWDGLSWMLDD